MIVAALVWDPASQARLRDALRGQATVRFCERQSEVIALVENNLAGVAVVDMRDRDGQSTLPMVRYVRESYPSVPVLLYFAISPDTSRDVLAFARAGVNDLVLRDVDDLRYSLRTALSTAADHCSARAILSTFTPHSQASVIALILPPPS